MRILICNDDGYYSNGILALAETAARFGEVHVVAPDRQQSAVGHAITVTQPLRADHVLMRNGMQATAVSGTPADCVKLAHDKLLDFKPDLVLSGINHGSNAGVNTIYSGTVSAATEATILGYPAIAVSCTEFSEKADLSGCCDAAAKAIAFVRDHGLPPSVLLNINAPAGPLKGMKWTRQANSRYVEEFEQRTDPYNRPYYWITGKFELRDEGEDLDITALQAGYAAVTPIHYDLTNHQALETLRRNPF